MVHYANTCTDLPSVVWIDELPWVIEFINICTYILVSAFAVCHLVDVYYAKLSTFIALLCAALVVSLVESSVSSTYSKLARSTARNTVVKQVNNAKVQYVTTSASMSKAELSMLHFRETRKKRYLLAGVLYAILLTQVVWIHRYTNTTFENALAAGGFRASGVKSFSETQYFIFLLLCIFQAPLQITASCF